MVRRYLYPTAILEKLDHVLANRDDLPDKGVSLADD